MARKSAYLGVYLTEQLMNEVREVAIEEYQGNQSHAVRELLKEALYARSGMAANSARRRRT